MATSDRVFRPDYAVHPGVTVAETIEALGINQADLARRSGLSAKTINQIIRGKAPITPETAVRLERVTGVPSRIWNQLEATYRGQLAQIEDEAELEAGSGWMQRLPVKELIDRGAVSPSDDRGELYRRLCAFFGVADWRAWNEVWLQPEATYRRSPAFDSDPGAVAAWLRLGELEAREIDCEAFDRERFKLAVQRIRCLTVEPPSVFEPAMTEACAASGVALVILPDISGTRLSGATRWITPHKAIIQLSLRYKTNDQFWFSFFHEAGHILLHGKRDVFIDDGGTEDAKEEEANRFAAETLIPSEHEGRLMSLRTLSEVQAFAEEIGIAPGVVVGRLQREGVFRYSVGNGLKQRFEFHSS